MTTSSSPGEPSPHDRTLAGAVSLEPSRYHCSPEWHLGALCGKHPLAGILYSFALRVSKNTNVFHGSVLGLAEYFGASRSTVHRAVRALVELGFFVVVAREPFQPTSYRVISHKEWALAHPGCCVEKEVMPWSAEVGDTLGVGLWNLSGGKVKFQPFHITALRNLIPSDEQIEAAFQAFINAEQSRRDSQGWHGRWAQVQPRFWRWVSGRANPVELEKLKLPPYSAWAAGRSSGSHMVPCATHAIRT